MNIVSPGFINGTVSHPVQAETRQTLYRPFGALRFGLALIVLLQHALHLMPSMDALPGFGVVAVAVFFAISGFIVAEANATFYAGRPGNFLLNRLLRIIPPYLAALALSIAVHQFLYAHDILTLWDDKLNGSPLRPLIILSGLASILPGMHAKFVSGEDFTFIPFAWSLRIELTFYLLAFLVYGAMHMRSRLIAPWVPRVIPYLAMSAGYGLVILYACNGNLGPQQQTNIPWFLLGISFYLTWRSRTFWHYLLLILTVILALTIFPLWPQRSATTPMSLQLTVLTGLTLLFIVLGFIPRVGDWIKAWDKNLGDVAYALYINHFAVLLLLTNLTAHRGWDIYFLGIAISVIIAIVMHHIVEMPLRQLRDRIRGAKL